MYKKITNDAKQPKEWLKKRSTFDKNKIKKNKKTTVGFSKLTVALMHLKDGNLQCVRMDCRNKNTCNSHIRKKGQYY